MCSTVTLGFRPRARRVRWASKTVRSTRMEFACNATLSTIRWCAVWELCRGWNRPASPMPLRSDRDRRWGIVIKGVNYQRDSPYAIRGCGLAYIDDEDPVRRPRFNEHDTRGARGGDHQRGRPRDGCGRGNRMRSADGELSTRAARGRRGWQCAEIRRFEQEAR